MNSRVAAIPGLLLSRSGWAATMGEVNADSVAVFMLLLEG
jgi:hypothetical protein